MRQKAHGQVRRSQVVTTYGPGALIDLPHESAIVAGLDEWPPPHKLEEVDEPRLARKLRAITGVAVPRMVAPPPASSDPGATPVGIGAWRFPEWFVVQEAAPGDGPVRSRRLVHRKALDDHRRFEGRPVVATRFVRACPRGHVDDVDWRRFVHRRGSDCPPTRPLWLDEQGTTGDLADLLVRCECGASRRLSDASMREHTPLGTCSGARPWLGRGANEDCNLPSRLLVRTASNAWFPQVVSVLSLPERGSAVETAVRELWDDLAIVDDASHLAFIKKKPRVAAALAAFTDDEVLAAIHAVKGAIPGTERSVKEIELEALLAAPEGYGDDVPVDQNFHARRLPDAVWRRSERSAGIESVIQLHRLREVLALAGFTRFEAVTPDIHGEYESDVERAAIAMEPGSFPAVENRGEGLSALETGTLSPPYRPVAVRAALGGAPESEAVAGALAELAGLGVSGPACAAWLRGFDRVAERRAAPDFVWSGPEVAGLHARDTRRVYEELLGSAARSAWVATYAFFDGPRAFEVLARRMDETPGLAVTLLLNVQRRKGDTTGADHLVRRFADRFWEQDWPGAARPRVFYDPRSLDPDGGAGVLHAKAVVVDDEAVFVTSANLTEAALDRNIEIGLLVRDRALAATMTRHFTTLIERSLLQPLPA